MSMSYARYQFMLTSDYTTILARVLKVIEDNPA